MFEISRRHKCGGRVENITLTSNPPIYKSICENCGEFNSVGWTKDIIYMVYCNDDLNELPISILEDMRDYITEIIDNKK